MFGKKMFTDEVTSPTVVGTYVDDPNFKCTPIPEGAKCISGGTNFFSRFTKPLPDAIKLELPETVEQKEFKSSLKEMSSMVDGLMSSTSSDQNIQLSQQDRMNLIIQLGNVRKMIDQECGMRGVPVTQIRQMFESQISGLSTTQSSVGSAASNLVPTPAVTTPSSSPSILGHSESAAKSTKVESSSSSQAKKKRKRKPKKTSATDDVSPSSTGPSAPLESRDEVVLQGNGKILDFDQIMLESSTVERKSENNLNPNSLNAGLVRKSEASSIVERSHPPFAVSDRQTRLSSDPFNDQRSFGDNQIHSANSQSGQFQQWFHQSLDSSSQQSQLPSQQYSAFEQWFRQNTGQQSLPPDQQSSAFEHWLNHNHPEMRQKHSQMAAKRSGLPPQTGVTITSGQRQNNSSNCCSCTAKNVFFAVLFSFLTLVCILLSIVSIVYITRSLNSSKLGVDVDDIIIADTTVKILNADGQTPRTTTTFDLLSNVNNNVYFMDFRNNLTIAQLSLLPRKVIDVIVTESPSSPTLISMNSNHFSHLSKMSSRSDDSSSFTMVSRRDFIHHTCSIIGLDVTEFSESTMDSDAGVKIVSNNTVVHKYSKSYDKEVGLNEFVQDLKLKVVEFNLARDMWCAMLKNDEPNKMSKSQTTVAPIIKTYCDFNASSTAITLSPFLDLKDGATTGEMTFDSDYLKRYEEFGTHIGGMFVDLSQDSIECVEKIVSSTDWYRVMYLAEVGTNTKLKNFSSKMKAMNYMTTIFASSTNVCLTIESKKILLAHVNSFVSVASISTSMDNSIKRISSIFSYQ